MDMIRHNNVTTYSDAIMLRSIAERVEPLVYFSPREDGPALISIKGHEIKRPNAGAQTFEPRGTSGMVGARFIAHGGQCDINKNCSLPPAFSLTPRRCSHGAASQ